MMTPEALAKIAETRRLRREAMQAAGKRVCSGPCGRELPFSEFRPHPQGLCGTHSRCRDCERAAAREDVVVNRDRRNAYKRRYRKEQKEKVSAYKREYGKRLVRLRNEAYIHLRNYHNERARIVEAVETGKASPICRKVGFSLVVCAPFPNNGGIRRYRAARLDKPLEKGEHAVVHFEFGVGSCPWWIVQKAPLATEQDEMLRQRLTAREQRLRQKGSAKKQ